MSNVRTGKEKTGGREATADFQVQKTSFTLFFPPIF